MRQLVLTTILTCMPLAAQMGQLNISVSDYSGVKVNGALVSVSARPIYSGVNSKPGPLNYNVSGRTNAGGTFSLTSIPAGSYAICARMPGSLLVDSCSWNDNPVTVRISAGSTASSDLVLKRGVQAVVQVNDAIGLLASEVSPGHSLRLVVGTSGGQRVPMLISQKAALKRQFSLVVPADTDLKLQVRSETLQVSDVNGNKLNMKDSAAFLPMRIAPSASTLTSTAVPQLQLNLVGLQ